MENLEQRINSDFVTAFKEKNESKKNALSLLKAKLIDKRKELRKDVLTDDEIFNVINSMIKQRNGSIELYLKGDREQLAIAEQLEIDIIKEYLPKQFTNEELIDKLKNIMFELPDEPNQNKRNGMIIGAFNKKYRGKADVADIKAILSTSLA